MSDMVGDMRWLLAQNTTNVVLNSKYAKDLTEFMAMPEQEGAELMPDRSVPAFERLEFKTSRSPILEATPTCSTDCRLPWKREGIIHL